MFDIKDKNVLITGATSGIGRAAAIELSSIGANIFFVARSESKAQLLVDDINKINEKEQFRLLQIYHHSLIFVKLHKNLIHLIYLFMFY